MSIPKTSPQVLGFLVIKAYGSPVACFTAAGWWLLSNHTLLKESPLSGKSLMSSLNCGTPIWEGNPIIFGNWRDVFIKK